MVVVQAQHGMLQEHVPQLVHLPAEVVAADPVNPHIAVPGGRQKPRVLVAALIPNDLADGVERLFFFPERVVSTKLIPLH